MNYTQNYQLNQWEALDKVQRTDFNADNAKIDAAMKAVDAKADTKADKSALSALTGRVAGLEDTVKLHAIKNMTFPENKSNTFVLLDDIDWTQWKIVATIIRARMDTGTCRLFSMGGVQDTSVLSYGNDFVIVQFPLYRSDLPFMGLLLSDNGRVFSFGTSCQNARGFSLSPMSSQTLLGGSATVYGIK